MNKVDGEVKAVKSTINQFIELIREIFDADVCHLYLVSENMDIDEKQNILSDRIKEIKEAYLARSIDFPVELEQSNAYDINILKFIDLVAKSKEKRWNYDYRKSPAKYVIFKNYPENEEILGEGITAYIVRSKKVMIFNNNSEITEHKSLAYLNNKKDIAPPCYMMIGFPLIDERGNAIGVLKIENYDIHITYNYTEVSKQIIETIKYLPLLVRLIKSSKVHFHKNSYKKLFGGMNLLKCLKRINPHGLVNKKIYERTLHLFFVLKRNEYIGHKEIFDRVTAYAYDIGECLNLTKNEMYFHKFLDEFNKHEELLLYGLDEYIDTFMHQFHVFISGYIIINELGIEVFKSKIEESMRFTSKQTGKFLELDDGDVLRIWYLTSFYHDHAYILEKVDTNLPKFFNNVLGYPFQLTFNWEQILTKESGFSRNLYELVKFFDSPKKTNPDTLLMNYLNSIIKNHDHGVLSALLLISYNSAGTLKSINEYLYAAFAISLHNHTVYENLREGNKGRISFESFPIAFLLAYCDTAQSFGRLQRKDCGKSFDYPIVFSDIILNGRNVTYELEYISDRLEEIPTSEKLDRYAQNINNVFKSEEYSFEITYCRNSYFLPNEKEPIHTISF